jgi:hypothetical protein
MLEFKYLNKVWFLVILLIILLLVVYMYRNKTIERFEDYFKSESEYKNQVKLLTDKYESMSDRRRPVTDLLSKNVMPVNDQSFVNFHSLGCRYTGYIGPMNEGYFDPDTAVQLAVKAGCRTFILEIDYLDECTGDTLKYFPRIVVRDAQGKLRINYNSSKPRCNSSDNSTIRDVCEKINYYAFASGCQNKDDPVVVVLYFLRQPPGSYKSKTVLDYYSHVAKALSPFKDRLLGIELEGGTYYRQSQEGRLLINNITTYNRKVLIFSNANTSGFRETKIYSSNDDLDFLTNLRLMYTQSKLGITETGSTAPFGILETAENYTIIPEDRKEEIIDTVKLRWTICFSEDPSKSVTEDVYNKISNTFGIHCVPILLFDTKVNDFMFTDKTFKTHSFIPKAKPLRYTKPPIVIPAVPNPSTNANQGMLRPPTVR